MKELQTTSMKLGMSIIALGVSGKKQSAAVFMI